MIKKYTEGEFSESMPILSALNKEIFGVIRWCTPSIHPMVYKVNGIYDTDMSISYHSLGNPSMNTGIFEKAHKLAANAYGSKNTLFTVNGSTGSNFIVLRALFHQLGNVNMLAQRNVHKSISVAVEDYQINVNYLRPHYDESWQIFIPNTVEEFVEGLRKFPETNVIFISNPTYEGLSLDLPKLVKEIRKINSKIIIFVDEAWGSLFPFSNKLPVGAMEAGADICVQSTHKQASGLQQTSMIHWQGKNVIDKYIRDSYKSLMTTSPSFHLLASLDAARYLFETRGGKIINELIGTTDLLKDELSKIKTLKVITGEEIMKKYSQVVTIDRTKVLVNVKKTRLAGHDIARSLEEDYKVILEKYEAENILFITALQDGDHEVHETIERVKACLAHLNNKKSKKVNSFPKFPLIIDKAFSAHELKDKNIVAIGINSSIGLVCAEDVVPYPPGIPLVTKGEIINKEHVEYMKAVKKLKGLISLVITDEKNDTILTVNSTERGIKNIQPNNKQLRYVSREMTKMTRQDKMSTKIPDYLTSAMRFDKTYFDIPVRENKEKLVSIKSIFSKNRFKIYFGKNKTGDNKKIFLVREGLAKPLLGVVKDLNKIGLTVRFEYAYRTVSGQKKMYLEMLQRIEKEFPNFEREKQLTIAGVYAAWNLATAAHVGGAALDIMLVDLFDKDLDMGAKYLENGPKTTTNSKKISKKAQRNRKILLDVMEKFGFANYPFEFWHFSMGDKIAAMIQKKKFAIYGPVAYDKSNNSVSFITKEDQERRFINK